MLNRVRWILSVSVILADSDLADEAAALRSTRDLVSNADEYRCKDLQLPAI